MNLHDNRTIGEIREHNKAQLANRAGGSERDMARFEANKLYTCANCWQMFTTFELALQIVRRSSVTASTGEELKYTEIFSLCRGCQR